MLAQAIDPDLPNSRHRNTDKAGNTKQYLLSV
jgi:hypothetical protein